MLFLLEMIFCERSILFSDLIDKTSDTFFRKNLEQKRICIRRSCWTSVKLAVDTHNSDILKFRIKLTSFCPNKDIIKSLVVLIRFLVWYYFKLKFKSSIIKNPRNLEKIFDSYLINKKNRTIMYNQSSDFWSKK